MATRATYPLFKALTSTGNLGTGYLLYTYAAGTSDLLTTYTNPAGTVAHTNPIVLDELGEAEIFLTASAKFTLTDALGNIQPGWPIDNINPASVTAEQVSYTPSGSLSSTDVQDALDEIIADIDIISDSTSGNNYSRGIVGGDMIGTYFNYVMLTECKCWDSTGLDFLEVTGGVADYAVGSSSGKIYKVYACRMVDDDSCTFRCYDTENAQADADVLVKTYRLLDFFQTDSEGLIKTTLSIGGFHAWGKASQAILSAGIGTTYAIIDHSVLFPLEMVSAIEYGVKDAATAGSILASDDGTNVSFVVGLSTATSGDTAAGCWGDTTSNKMSLKPFTNDRVFKSSTGTLDLLCHQVVLRR